MCPIHPLLIRGSRLSPIFGRLRSSIEGCGSASASEATGTAGASPNPKKKQARPKKKRKRCADICWTPYRIDFDPTAVRRAREYHLRLRILGAYTTLTSSHILSNGLNSAENVPLPVTANKKPKMTRCFIRYQTNQTPLTRLSRLQAETTSSYQVVRQRQTVRACQETEANVRAPCGVMALCSPFSIVAKRIRN